MIFNETEFRYQIENYILYIINIAYIIDKETVYNCLTMKLETEGKLDHRTFVYRSNTQNARETFIDASPRRRCVTKKEQHAA